AYQTTSGTYTDMFTTPGGCDSIVTTQLYVLPQLNETVFPVICEGESYFAGGAMQAAAGNYVDTFTASGGCDSIVLTKLTVQPARHQTVNAAICAGDFYFAGGANQSTAGTYFDTLLTVNGCDSFLTTILTVNPLPAGPVITQLGNSLSVPAVYVSYQWYKDGVPLANANLNVTQAAGEGDYYVRVSDANGCSAFSDTLTVVFTGINPVLKTEMNLLPNPVTDELKIIFSNIISGSLNVEVYNALGEKAASILNPSFHDDVMKFDMAALSSGIYFVKIRSESFSLTGRVVKK
ncbi:MAG TPA: T9SS type A sorting domain-containing protein, partial [Chitinophagales bacterium]|nr:T9SS type A sorting domain-containing protein [Chitinophagales bacterium]